MRLRKNNNNNKTCLLIRSPCIILYSLVRPRTALYGLVRPCTAWPNIALHSLAEYDLYSLAEYDLHSLAEYELHSLAEYDLHSLAEYDLHSLAEYELHSLAEYELYIALLNTSYTALLNTPCTAWPNIDLLIIYTRWQRLRSKENYIIDVLYRLGNRQTSTIRIIQTISFFLLLLPSSAVTSLVTLLKVITIDNWICISDPGASRSSALD